MSATDPSHAIVSCCDRNYLWGAFLLVASLRRHNMRMPIYLLTSGLSVEDMKLLTQFGDVHLSQPEDASAHMDQTQKPGAILLAQAHDVITWMDSDCMVTGDVTPLLALENQGLMIRFRGFEENKSRFKAFDTPLGEIPQTVLDIWRKDVSEEQEPRIATTCSANAFSIGRAHLPFVLRWERQIKAILKTDPKAIRYAYPYSSGIGVSDELILNSLLAFASDVPPFSEYTLDKDPGRLLVHFPLQPKPWERWTLRTLRHRALIQNVLEWVAQGEYVCPDKPAHFNQSGRYTVYVRAAMGDFIYKARKALARISRRFS